MTGFGRWRPESSRITATEEFILTHSGLSRMSGAATPCATTGRTYRCADRLQTRATTECPRHRTVGAFNGGILARLQAVTRRLVESSVRVLEQVIAVDGWPTCRSFARRIIGFLLKRARASLAVSVDSGPDSGRQDIRQDHAHADRAAAARLEGEYLHWCRHSSQGNSGAWSSSRNG